MRDRDEEMSKLVAQGEFREVLMELQGSSDAQHSEKSRLVIKAISRALYSLAACLA